MTFLAQRHSPVVVRADQAEHLASIGHTLLADADVTGGALSTHLVRLARGGERGGAPPPRQRLRAVLHL
jgi:hypothetical protein